MTNSSLYNGQNLDFTGNKNPYGLIQNAGKRKRKGRGRKGTKSKKNKSKKSRSKKSRRSNKRTRKHRR